MKLIREERIQICAVLETHVKAHKLQKVCYKTFSGWKWASNSVHSPNGCRIVVAWNDSMVNVMVMHNSRQLMLCIIETIPCKVKIFCSFVYAANTAIERRNVWNDLCMAKNVIVNHSWLVMGDFNVTMDCNEHSFGGLAITRDMQEFIDCVNTIEVEDICSSEYEHVVMNMTCLRLPAVAVRNTCRILKNLLDRVSQLQPFSIPEMYERQVYWNSVLMRFMDDLLALDSIVRFGFSDRRLELTATFSVSANSE
ncbi:RNA-directed DNA polymerase, eukaryota, reverse transcriptase zinc-binding domain protein [Tanacetum coccineum]